MENLSNNFLEELFKCAFYKKDVIEILCTHLKYQYIPNELQAYKKILKTLIDHYNNYSQIPTIGIVSQKNQQDDEVQEILDRVREIALPDKDLLLSNLEDYIKRVRFQLLYVKQAELYNAGKQKEAIDLSAKESQEISNFSIHANTDYLKAVFGDFRQREIKRRENSFNQQVRKIPIGIDGFDVLSRGGLDCKLGETLCFLGRSGTGKTKFLRWCGVAAARRGFNVLHIQGEGTEDETMDGYDATWTGVLKYDLYSGDIPEETEKKIEKSLQAIKAKKAEIHVKAYEEFDTASMKDIRNIIIDYYKIHGRYPDLLLLDYLELFDPGDGKRYGASTEGEKMRREASARKFRNICNEFSISGITASQATDIAPSDYNDPSWYMTRHNTSSAKGLVDSFSYFVTYNVTNDEYHNNVARIFVDKARNVKGRSLLRIATNYDRDRFYDRNRTIALYGNDFNKTSLPAAITKKKKELKENEQTKTNTRV